MNALAKEFDEKGFVVLESVLSPEEVKTYLDEMKSIGAGRKKDTWTVNNGITAIRAFWSLILNERLVAKMREIFGDEVKFCQHNDVQHGYSSFAWHRDSINRYYDPKLPDWLEDDEPYRIARCGCYLQPESHNFHFGVVPGSHKPSGFLSRKEFLEADKYLSHFHNLKAKAGGKDILKERATWIKTVPGNVVVFDPRLIHTGGEFDGSKYSLFSCYGIVNRHFKEHYTYYRHLRWDLEYANLPEELVDKLKAENLYAEEIKYMDKLKDAFIPSKAFNALAKVFDPN